MPAGSPASKVDADLVPDKHWIFDVRLLLADKIIAHHNRVLSGIVAAVKPAAEIVL